MKKFKYNVPTHLFFYTPVFKCASVKYSGKRIVGDYYANFIYGQVGTAIVPEESFSTPGNYFLDLIEKGDKFTDYFYTLALNLIELSNDLQQRYYEDIKFDRISDIKDFYPKYSEIFTPAIGLGYSLDFAFDQYIKKHGIDPSSLHPAGLSFQAKEKLDLKKVFEIADPNEQKEALKDHTYKYAWLLNDYTGEHQIELSYFLNRKEEVASYVSSFKNRGLDKPTNVKEWISFLIYIRDERKRANLLNNGLLDRYLKQECKNRNIDYSHAAMCTVDEFEKNKHDPSFIENINTNRFLRFTITGHENISSDEWDQISIDDKESSKEITGQIACKGVAKGKAKIIMHKSDFIKMEVGDIIIASMTRPEYAPILSKCSAIVTNEGGITCHAAIVSRELKVPCIIGTKNATNILKDGDLIEVDANKGIVRKLG